MAKTNAEHQKAYRRRSELVRLDIRIEGGAKRALTRLAAHMAMTQSAALSEVILKAERDATAEMDAQAREDFYDCKPRQNITG